MDPDRLSAVCRARGVRLMLQFGSTVSGRIHGASDIDLAVLLGRRPVSLDEQAELVADLKSLLPGREVDVALINGADRFSSRRSRSSAGFSTAYRERCAS
jgi:predicted nucleotidyltransferase